MPIAQTPRLILREFEPADAAAMMGVFGDAEVMRFGRGVQTAQWVGDWLRRCIEEEYTRWGFGIWAVVETLGGGVIGYCGLSQLPERCAPGEAELCYRYARPHWGLGYGTEAAAAVRDHAFAKLCIPRLVAMIDPNNVASVRVAQKIGMRYERDAMFEGY